MTPQPAGKAKAMEKPVLPAEIIKAIDQMVQAKLNE